MLLRRSRLGCRRLPKGVVEASHLAIALLRADWGDSPEMGDCAYCGKPEMMFRIGIISDTHGLLRPEAERRLMGVDHIVHAGDIGHPGIIDALRRIAPVTAIRGNVDSGEWAREYPDTQLMRLAGKSIYVLHDLKKLQVDPAGFDVIVSGHSHNPKIDTVGGVLYVNPGSAGRRRFRLPVTLATLEVTPGGIRPEIHHLGDG
jgi:putative phosphoesterase